MPVIIKKKTPELTPLQALVNATEAEAPKAEVLQSIAKPQEPEVEPEVVVTVEAAPSLAPAPVVGKPQQTLLEAIAEWVNRSSKDERVLMVVRNDKVISYKVVAYDEQTKRTRMVTTDNIEINPIITERENALYFPLWR